MEEITQEIFRVYEDRKIRGKDLLNIDKCKARLSKENRMFYFIFC